VIREDGEAAIVRIDELRKINRRFGMRPKILLGMMLLVACMLGLSSGCNSGTVKGAGSDIERLGEKMQR